MTNKDLILQARQEYQDKLGLKAKLDEYYLQQQTKYGLKPLDKIKAYLPQKLQPLAIRRDIAIAHLDFEPILQLIAESKTFTVVSGLNPSSPLHLGHKTLFDLLKELQRMGAKLHIPVTDDESYLDEKTDSLNLAQELGDTVVSQLKDLEYDQSRTNIYLLSQQTEIYRLAIKISRLVTPQQLKKVFGDEALENVGQIFYRGALQLAQILAPQLPKNGGPKHILIPVGIDQHPYILLARDVAKKLSMTPPSELVLRFQPSLRDPEQKMSGSKPETAIYLTDSETEIKNKINRAYTGAVSVLEVHQELGGIPEICSVFNILSYHHSDDSFVNQVYDKYQNGKLSSGGLKQIVINYLVKQFTLTM